jgi:hypothetical protein
MQAEHSGTLVRYSDHSVGFDFGFGFAMNGPRMATTCRKSGQIAQIVEMPVLTALERCPFSSRVPKKRVAARLWYVEYRHDWWWWSAKTQTVRKGAESFARGRFLAAGLDALAGGVWIVDKLQNTPSSGLHMLFMHV